MKIEFEIKAAEAIIPHCFDGNAAEALTAIGQNVLRRANKDTGDSYAEVAGKIIALRVFERWKNGELVALICLKGESQ